MIKNQNHLGGIYMILSVLFFSLMDILIKITDEYDVGQVMFCRAIFGLIPIFFLIPKKNYKEEIEKSIKQSKIKIKEVFYYDSDPTKLTNQIEKITKLASKSKLDVFYFADSLGSMDPSQISNLVKIFRKNWNGSLGIHTHDNLGKAIANSLAARNLGVTWLDCTVMGMGRGAGNAQTEYLLIEMQNIRKRETNISCQK